MSLARWRPTLARKRTTSAAFHQELDAERVHDRPYPPEAIDCGTA